MGEIGDLLLEQLNGGAIEGELVGAFEEDEAGADGDGQEDGEGDDDDCLIGHGFIIGKGRY